MKIESRLKGIVSEKDVNSVFLKVNDVIKYYSGLDPEKDIVGKTDFDLCWAEYAPLYLKHEQDALKENYYNLLLPLKNHDGERLLFLHTKTAKKDQNNKIIGISCIAQEIINPSMHVLISHLSKHYNSDNMPYTYGKKIDVLDFSPREKQCLFYLARGKTAKAIARILDISSRTVEFYIAKLKDKLGCRTRMELIDFALAHKLLESIPEGIPLDKLIDSLK